VALFDESFVQAGEGLFLGILQRFKLSKGEALEEPGILLDVATEEETGGNHQDRLAALWAERHERRKIRVAGGTKALAHLFERLHLRFEQRLRVVVAGEGRGLAGECGRVERTDGKQVCLGGSAQLAEAILSELDLARQLGEWAGVEEGTNLLAEGLVVGGAEDELALVPEGVAGKGDLNGLPGVLG